MQTLLHADMAATAISALATDKDENSPRAKPLVAAFVLLHSLRAVRLLLQQCLASFLDNSQQTKL
jgi:hypothetical protein